MSDMEKSYDINPYMSDLITYLRSHEEERSGEEASLAPATEMTNLSREIGAFYERLRFAVDNKEEHFFRRYAIRRIIRRMPRVGVDVDKLIHRLIADLDRGGYLREGELGSARIGQVRTSLIAFLDLSEALRTQSGVNEFRQTRAHLLDIMAGAIEDALYNTTREEGVVVMMARSAMASVSGEALESIPAEKRGMHFYIASWRSLFSADSALLRYKLWLFAHPHWDNQSKYPPEELAKTFRKEIFYINIAIDHPLGGHLLPRLHNLSIAHTLIYDAVTDFGAGLAGLLLDPQMFHSRMRGYITARYERSIARVKRRSIQTIFYIFVTKSLLVVAVESVYVVLLKHAINYLSIAINLVFHPALLFLLTGGVRPPNSKNTDRAVGLAEDVVYNRALPQVEIPTEKKGIFVDIALGFYIFFLMGSMWGIIAALHALNFYVVDIVFFIFFLLLVLYFGYRIRFAAHRMRLTGSKEGFIRSLIDLCLLPLVSLGRYMTVRFERINVAVFFLDFIIESPLRLILRFFDTFSSFVDKQRDEIYTP